MKKQDFFLPFILMVLIFFIPLPLANVWRKTLLTTLCKFGWGPVLPPLGGLSSRSIQFLNPNQPGIEHLVGYRADKAGLLTLPFHHPRIDGGLKPFVPRHGLEMSIFLDRVSARIQVINPKKTTLKNTIKLMLVITHGSDR